MTRGLFAAACAALLFVAACGQKGPDAAGIADTATRAVYDDNVAALLDNFDTALRPSVTRTQVAELSDKMHAFGDYQGLTATSNDTINRRYDFRANFSKGAMTVQMRLDPDGKIAAFYVVPGTK